MTAIDLRGRSVRKSSVEQPSKLPISRMLGAADASRKGARILIHAGMARSNQLLPNSRDAIAGPSTSSCISRHAT